MATVAYASDSRQQYVERGEYDRLHTALEELRRDCGDPEGTANQRWIFARVSQALESSAPETACRIDDKDIRMFLGWLSVELPELHAIETSRLGRAWEKWLELMHAQETAERRETGYTGPDSLDGNGKRSPPDDSL
jgi:hypothetical protein